MRNGIARVKKHSPAAACILDAVLRAADPAFAVRNGLHSLQADGVFTKGQTIGLVAMGKASVAMARAACEELGAQIQGGIVIGKMMPEDVNRQLPELTVLSGAHPTPDESSLAAGKAVMEFLESNKNLDYFLFLISGGASSLVTNPSAGISLEDLKRATSMLLGCGASIDEINTVRKHIDSIKGGGLARMAAPVPCISLVLSDVPGDRLDMIASGPTVPDLTTFRESVDVLKKYALIDAMPVSVREHLMDGIMGWIPETPKPGDDIFKNNRVMIVGSLEKSILAAVQEAEHLGYQCERIQPLLQGEAADQGKRLGRFLAEQAASVMPGERRCWVGGGETTVTLGDAPTGKGGRNQELALAAVEVLDGARNAVLIAFATDGDDGLSPAAGAIVTGNTMYAAGKLGLNAAEYLTRHDSYSYFAALDAAIVSGPTGTNVNDLVILLVN